MAINITQPFGFDSKLPNFERDTINSLNDYYNHHPLKLKPDELTETAAKYDIGHIVYDTYTMKHYVWLGRENGWGVPSVQTFKSRFANIGNDDEVLYIDGEEHVFVKNVGTAVFIKTDGQPQDWNENYSEYYTWNESGNTYEPNVSPEYDSHKDYYIKTLSTIFV